MRKNKISPDFTNREAKMFESARERVDQQPPKQVSVLIVSPSADDCLLLRRMLPEPEFAVRSVTGAREAAALLKESDFGVVIAECKLDDGCWKTVWKAVQQSSQRPQPRLVVSSTEAGDTLWTEVIDAGACDVLTRPFDAEEVAWTVRDAHQAWQRDWQLLTPAQQGRRAARSGAL